VRGRRGVVEGCLNKCRFHEGRPFYTNSPIIYDLCVSYLPVHAALGPARENPPLVHCRRVGYYRLQQVPGRGMDGQPPPPKHSALGYSILTQQR
jgi:hypothetical protein